MDTVLHRIAWMLLPVGAVTLGMNIPFENTQWLTLVVFVPLALVLRQAGPASGLLAGWMFGSLGWGFATWWLLRGMSSLLSLSAWQAAPGSVLFWLYQGLPFAILGAVCGWMNRRGHTPGPVFCASLLCLLITLRPALCPLSGAASAALWPEFIQVADLGGEPLVLFILLLANWLAASALQGLVQKGSALFLRRAVALAVMLCAVLGYGHWRLAQQDEAMVQLPSSRMLTVATVQPNATVRWGTENHPMSAFATDEELGKRTLLEHRDRVLDADLLVFPELPRSNCREGEFRSSGLAAALTALRIPTLLPSDEYLYAKEPPTTIVSHGDRSITTRRINAKYNAVFTLQPGDDIPELAYRKIKLVPFSEATPGRDALPWLRTVLGRSLETTPGDGVRLIEVGGLRIQPLICFESGFSGLVREGVALGADMLVEMTNDGWFASRQAEMQHLVMGIFRAVEMRRPLVRCSNTGGGAHIDASGRILPGTLTQHDIATVTTATQWCPKTTTPYSRFGTLWLWALALPVAVGLILAAGSKRTA